MKACFKKLQELSQVLIYVVYTRHELDACWNVADGLNGIR